MRRAPILALGLTLVGRAFAGAGDDPSDVQAAEAGRLEEAYAVWSVALDRPTLHHVLAARDGRAAGPVSGLILVKDTVRARGGSREEVRARLERLLRIPPDGRQDDRGEVLDDAVRRRGSTVTLDGSRLRTNTKIELVNSDDYYEAVHVMHGLSVTLFNPENRRRGEAAGLVVVMGDVLFNRDRTVAVLDWWASYPQHSGEDFIRVLVREPGEGWRDEPLWITTPRVVE